MSADCFASSITQRGGQWPGGSLCLALLCLLVSGCRPENQAPIVPAQSKDAPSFSTGSADHLKLAMSFIDSLNEYSEVEILSRIHHHLSKWIKESEPDDDWIADPLFGRLPDRLNVAKGRAALSKLVFTDADVATMREAMWLRNVSNGIAKKPVGDVELAKWIADDSGLEVDAARDLGLTYELFDWVVRNIQSEPTMRTPDGINYSQRMVWEAMLQGRGDEWAKSRTFILMARQLGIPVVMLAVDQDEGSPQEWLSAAMIGDQLYLFDMQLGVPVPASDNRGIATLAKVVEQPKLLQQLKVDGDDYRVASSDLGKLVALIDGTPEYLSQRLKMVEEALTSVDKMKLTCRPSILARELRQCKGITNVALWPLHYDSIQARIALRKNPEQLVQIQRESAFLSGQLPIARGRLQHFRGRLLNTPTEKGAKELYMQSRIPDAQIEQLTTNDASLRALLNLTELPDNPQTKARLTGAMQQQMRLSKEIASLWLGLLAFEQDRFKVAVDFFEKRCLKSFPDGRSSSSAAYNLGRSYERWGIGNEENPRDPALIEKAIAVYDSISDDTVAPSGKIRALRLRNDSVGASNSPTSESAETES